MVYLYPTDPMAILYVILSLGVVFELGFYIGIIIGGKKYESNKR